MAVTTFYYGASGDQPRAVVDRKPADIVNFSVEPGVTRLVRADEVAKDWNADNIKSIPFGSRASHSRVGSGFNALRWLAYHARGVCGGSEAL